MTRLDVKVQDDHLEKLTRPARRLAGIGELVWNSLDAEANDVVVRVIENGLDGIDAIEVVDDGHGITYEHAVHDYENLGGSWKRTDRKSPNVSRDLHGSEGEGRWRAFALGNIVRWNSVVEVDGQRQEIEIACHFSGLKTFEVSEPQATEKPVGTTVTIEDIREEVITQLLSDAPLNYLSAEFALYLEKYPGVKIRYRGFDVDPSAVERLRLTYPIEVENEYGPAEITVIEWTHDVHRAMLLCDESGLPLAEIPPGIQAPAFEFTSYIRWAGFRQHDAAELVVPELHPTLQPIIDGGKDRLRAHFKERAAEVEAEVIKEWKEQDVYPYDADAETPTERVERDLFDVVAVTASRAVNTTSDRVARKLSLRLLKEALEQDPGSLHRVLTEVLDLSQARLKELEQLLERTSLTAIISAARVVADRLDFLKGLDVLLFEEDTKKVLLERTQLHRMLATETWVFGDEYALAVDDESLTRVLQKHINLLGRDELAAGEPEALRPDGTRGIVDLMFGQTIEMAVKQQEHLVVELKRPDVKVGTKELAQIQGYATTVAEDERYDKTNTNWNFWLVANELDAYAKQQAQQANRPWGLVFEVKGIKVWVKTWAQVIEECEHRLKFVKSNLDIQSTREDAVESLRRTYARLLPSTVAGNEAAT